MVELSYHSLKGSPPTAPADQAGASNGGLSVMHSSIRRWLAVLAAIAVMGVLGGCARDDTGVTTAGNVHLVQRGELTVCTHLPYAPFQSKDADGTVIGFDVELVDLVAKRLGVEQTIVDTPFEGIRSGQDLSTGKCDVAAAGMTITEERKRVLDFSDPYFDATQALLVKTGTPGRSLDDLSGKRVGAQAATTGLEYVKRFEKEKGYTVVDYRDLAAEQQALGTGQIDAAVNDLPVWTEYVRNSPGTFEISTEFDTGEQYGFAVRRNGNPQLLATINEVLATAKRDGTYDRIYEKWIGKAPAR